MDIGISKDGIVEVNEESKRKRNNPWSYYNPKTKSFNTSFLLLSDSETAISARDEEED